MTKKNSRRSGRVITIHDVARHADVSPMTVSRVINGESNVREETRARVMTSIAALRYKPNQAARSLATAETTHIGILYANPSANYLSEFLLGSLEQSSLSGCQLVIEKCEAAESEVEAIERLVKGGIDGVILPAPLCDSEETLNAVRGAGLPAVLVASGKPAADLSAVSINNFEASRAMTRHLLELGHRRIAFINGHPNQTGTGQRFHGYVEAMTEAGLSVDADLVAQGSFTYRSGLEAAERLLDGGKPTAIFASNDDMAAATMAVAHRRGLDVPRDLSVTGFDDTPLAVTVWPPLTTIHQPIVEMAREAVRLLIGQIRGRRAGSEPQVAHRMLKFTLVKRDSCAPLESPAPDKRTSRRKAAPGKA
ncbi:MAG TPA: LacI family DNA-binding transcriptional regulator [Rhizomicrobium sp.]|nr:LacI family DNA-binding transcriptional regulator [Rhizomicrobium sp.]